MYKYYKPGRILGKGINSNIFVVQDPNSSDLFAAKVFRKNYLKRIKNEIFIHRYVTFFNFQK